jgi:hypothetical protein
MSRAPIPPLRGAGFLGPAIRPLNRAINQINDLASMDGVNAIIQRGPLGTTIINAQPKTRSREFFGVLVDGGPPASSSSGANQADFTDARYWVQELSLSQTQGASMTDPVSAGMDASFLKADGTYAGARWLVATNLNESLTGTHLLPTVPANGTSSLPSTATIVRVYAERASKNTTLHQGDYGNVVWCFEPVTNTGASKTSLKLTAVGGSFPQWSYTVQKVTGYDGTNWLTDGVNLLAQNTLETNTTSGTYGNGVTITSASGQVNSTSCVIVPIGIGSVVDGVCIIDTSGHQVWRFAQANSAQ